MNRKKVTSAMENISSEYIDEAASYNKVSVKKPWLKAGAIAACFALLAAIIGVWSGGLFKGPYVQPEYSDKVWPQKPATKEEINAQVKPWDERTISEQYIWLSIGENTYSSKNTETDPSNIGEMLGEYELNEKDSLTDTMYTATGTVYAVNGIATECAVAVQFSGHDGYYVYVNSYYTPATLGELIDDLNLAENISFGSVFYVYLAGSENVVTIEFVDLAESVIWDMLLNDCSVQNETDIDSLMANSMSISVNIPLLGYKNISLGVTDDGYLTTNILETGKAFFIGKERVQQFKNYVIENCQGYELVYEQGDTPENEHKGLPDDSLYTTPGVADSAA